PRAARAPRGGGRAGRATARPPAADARRTPDGADPGLRRDHEGNAGDAPPPSLRPRHAVGGGVGGDLRGPVAGGRGAGARHRGRGPRPGRAPPAAEVALHTLLTPPRAPPAPR